MVDSNKGGRPSLGADGENRDSVRIVGPDNQGFNLSLLTIQRDFLAAVGDGNRSEGFRRIIRFLAESARIYPLLETAVRAMIDAPKIDLHASTDLEDWLSELDRILEHGRTDTETVDAETSTES